MEKKVKKKNNGHGGARKGAGGPKKEKTVNVQKKVRVSIAEDVKAALNKFVAEREKELKNGKQEY